jgi:hypothetical protein
MDFREIGVDSSGSGAGRVTGCCESGNGTSDSIEYWKILAVRLAASEELHSVVLAIYSLDSSRVKVELDPKSHWLLL